MGQTQTKRQLYKEKKYILEVQVTNIIHVFNQILIHIINSVTGQYC